MKHKKNKNKKNTPSKDIKNKENRQNNYSYGKVDDDLSGRINNTSHPSFNNIYNNNENQPEAYEVPRTDLALEVRETFEDDDVEIKGVSLTEDYNEETDISVTSVVIMDQKGADVMKKPIGIYITIEAPRLNENDESYQRKLPRI